MLTHCEGDRSLTSFGVNCDRQHEGRVDSPLPTYHRAVAREQLEFNERYEKGLTK